MSQLKVLKPIAWHQALLNILVLGLMCFGGYWLAQTNGILIAAAIYLALAILLRSFLASHHRRGILFCKSENFVSAIGEFEKSINFFQKHPWIDRWRGLTMLSSGHSYIEMGLISLGFAHLQAGHIERAKECYQKCKSEFPFSQMAESGLQYIEATANGNSEDEING
jgi:tetratricopeptide (TPR) repeat protein